MIHLVWTDPAVTDLNGIHDYISRDSEIYADSVLTEIFETADRLILYPDSGRIVPEIGHEKTREVIVGSYRIIYDRQDDLVRILTILHAARLFSD